MYIQSYKTSINVRIFNLSFMYISLSTNVHGHKKAVIKEYDYHALLQVYFASVIMENT